ncbi:glutaredoxin [Aliivibrio fischeri]|uniref:glutaredoxin n=1 Tax=Aliivibrio fischeri TaxID=668 RepID=UPI0007C55527|nr:glutaredoxin [Aliivibrio fischeri]MBP3142083.1 glutaredoxin [Aliivibrio fischeri]MBP3157287.1 glutaredoxin [Aliivibrio fischeri]MCE7573812.1 glutaredoxin [Aliivibrio fischeri]TDM54555.1 glutaredoxin [Aliivibrio fischeri]
MLNTYQTIIFSKTVCPFCVKAKAILDDKGIEYKVLTLDEDLTKEEMVALIQEKENIAVNTVPQIYLDRKYIGGHDDLVAFFERQDTDMDLGDFEL